MIVPSQTSASVTIVLATFNPDLRFFDQQIQSIQAQTRTDWTCIVQDDCSAPETFEEIKKRLTGDARFQLRRNPGRLGVFHCFEAGLSAVPAAAKYVAFCDQDDEWDKDKLKKLVGALEADPRVQLAHSDLEIIDETGKVLHPSCWDFEGRKPELTGLDWLLLKNTVTGCTTLFRRELLARALPFPMQGRTVNFHHDLWLALIARSAGQVLPVREKLVHYRQHGGNVIGAEKLPETGSLSRVFQESSRKRYLSGGQHSWALRHRLFHEIQQRPASGSRGDSIRSRFGGRLDFGVPLLVFAFVARARSYVSFGYAFQIAVGKLAHDLKAVGGKFAKVGKLARMIHHHFGKGVERFRYHFSDPSRPQAVSEFVDSKSLVPLSLQLDPKLRARRSFNIFVPNVKPENIFGGLATAIKMGVEIAKNGQHVRFVATSQTFEPGDMESVLEYFDRTFPGFTEYRERIEFLDAGDRAKPAGAIGENDVIVATAWWTALLADLCIRGLNLRFKKFVYLIQDFEPGFYAWSSDYALAESSYKLDGIIPVFNTAYLREFFVKKGLPGASSALAIAPEISFERFFAPTEEEMRSREAKPRIICYGRPSISRNLFSLLVCGVEEWVKASGVQAKDVEIWTAGEVHRTVVCSNGVEIKSLGKLDYSTYPGYLRGFDIGVSLMLSPHPSYPPIEMAASGIIAVTNRYENKDLEAVSGNFVSCEPEPHSIGEAIGRAFAKRRDYAARIQNSRFAFEKSISMPEMVKGLLKEIGEYSRKDE